MSVFDLSRIAALPTWISACAPFARPETVARGQGISGTGNRPIVEAARLERYGTVDEVKPDSR